MKKIQKAKTLPPPPERVFYEKNPVKVTIPLNKASVEYFKNEAKNLKGLKITYQDLIRQVIEHHVAYAKQPPPDAEFLKMQPK